MRMETRKERLLCAALSDIKQPSVYSQKLPLRVPHHSTDLASVAVRVDKKPFEKEILRQDD